MRIDAVDFYYLSMPRVEDIGDGSQDALLVRVQSGPHVGWGECEASPLVTIASLVCPMSHSACKPVRDSVLGQQMDTPEDIRRIAALVRANSLDLLQADHALSGIEIALWDLLGRRQGEPVYRLLGYPKAYPKRPYASVLFGDSPQETLRKARHIASLGFHAAKFGWGPFGRSTVQADADQLMAAREGLGKHGALLVDAGTVWVDDVDAARLRLPALWESQAVWLEEPFTSGALGAYRALSSESKGLRLAGGEGCHHPDMGRHFIDYAGVGFIQIDTGRIGGIGSAKVVADYARSRGITYVNHTFTSHLALSASLQPYAGMEADVLCEYPQELKPLAWELTQQHLEMDANGHVNVPEAPGLGLEPDREALRKYVVEVEIRVGGRELYRTPAF